MTTERLGRIRRRRSLLAASLGVLALLASACGVVLDAPKIIFIADDEEIVYAQADGAEALTGGETVIEVRNASDVERQVVLARVPPEDFGERIPPQIRQAESALDDSRILGMSLVLEPEETDFSAEGFGKKTDSTSFHIYLRPGDRYVLFDRLSLDGDALVTWLAPGEEDARG